MSQSAASPYSSPSTMSRTTCSTGKDYDVERCAAGRDASPPGCLCLSAYNCILIWAFVALLAALFKFELWGGMQQSPFREKLYVLFSITICFIDIISVVARNRSLLFTGLMLSFFHFLYDLIFVFLFVNQIFQKKEGVSKYLLTYFVSLVAHTAIASFVIVIRRK